MAKPASKDWEIDKIDLTNITEVLKRCGDIFVREVCGCVLGGRTPEGGKQKDNKMSTVLAKGHDHPVIAKRARFTRPTTYRVTPLDNMSVKIGLRDPEDSRIAAELEDHGYHFFGPTEACSKAADELMVAYIDAKVVEAFNNA